MKVEQVAYDAGMTKTAQILTTQLRDVARASVLKFGVKPLMLLDLMLTLI